MDGYAISVGSDEVLIVEDFQLFSSERNVNGPAVLAIEEADSLK